MSIPFALATSTGASSRWVTRLVIAGVACLVLPVAQAGLFGDDEARQAIIDLRGKVEANRQGAEAADADLRKQLEEQTSTARRAALNLVGQIEALRSELAQLRGLNEQLARDVSELQRQQKSFAVALDDRLRTLEPIKISLDGVEFTAQPKEKSEFDTAMAAVRAADFDKAAELFGQFLRRYPDSGYLTAALFWQGNARYASREYKPAIDSYRTLLAKAPNHVRAPEAMLAIANCQQELKDARAAKRTLEDLLKSFPKTDAGATARDRLERMK